MPYSKANVILDAIHYATKADLATLRQLISTNANLLRLELVLRILLTYLPESTEPALYIPLLQDLSSGSVFQDKAASPPAQFTKDVSKAEARRRIRTLKLLKLDHTSITSNTCDLVERFLLCRAYRIDSEIRSSVLIQELIQPFARQFKDLGTWAIATLLPLQRIEQQESLDVPLSSLLSFEQIHGRSGLDLILAINREGKGVDYSSRLRGIVGPWMYGEISRADQDAKTTFDHTSARADHILLCWSIVNEWLLDLAGIDYESAIQTYMNWDGPADVHYGYWKASHDSMVSNAAGSAYQQLGMALAYASPDTSNTHRIHELLHVVAQKAANRSSKELDPQAFLMHQSKIPEAYMTVLSNVHLTITELLDSANPFTRPGEESISYAQFSLASSDMLSTLGIDLTLERVAHLALFEPAKAQWNLFSKAVHNLSSICGKNDKTWIEAKDKLLWLRDWKTNVQPGHARQGIFSQVDPEQLHFAIFESLITNGRYKLATGSYLGPTSDLPMPKVKDALINVVLASYDNASNGNKTRGGIKKAAEVITTFRSLFPEFQRMSAMWALIQATHRLSFYSLTLQHGVPLSPVNIRIHPEPLTLIDKVLEQNPGSYTKLDDLLDIGRDLVKAGRITFSSQNKTVPESEAIHQVEQSITAKAISASLSEDDFDTAYSYIVNRLSSMSTSDTSSDDHLWRAAYQAGRYTSQTKSSTSPSALRRLEQQMELLSQALLLAPTSSLQQVLSTWRECERHLNSALAAESREEDAWQAKGDRNLPGGFSRDEIAPLATKTREHTRRAMDEEAPMGLFDVARGAAAALSKSAFPLRSQTSRTSGETARSDEEAPQRVRKRDMVSNMVTGSLASGIGWVIGAPPAEHER